MTDQSPIVGARMRSNLILSLLDQVCLSVFSFALNLILIRFCGPELFGVFSIIIAICMFGLSAQSALVGSLLVVLRPQAANAEDDSKLVKTLWTANCALIAAAVVSTLIAVPLLLSGKDMLMPVAASLYVGSTLLREYVRVFLFSELRIHTVLATDGIFIGVAVSGLWMLWIFDQRLEIAQVCIVMALANVIASLPQLIADKAAFALGWDRATRSRYRRIWRDHARWTLLGAGASEIHSRIHVFIVGACFGSAAVGILQAGAMLLRPLDLTLQAWVRIAQPMFARLAAAGDLKMAHTRAHLSALGAAVATGLFGSILWLAWPQIEASLLRGAYSNIGLVVALWGIATFIHLLAGIYSTVLASQARYHELSLASIAAALIALILLVPLIALGSYEWSIAAIAAGSFVDLVLVTWLIARGRRTGRDDPLEHGRDSVVAVALKPTAVGNACWGDMLPRNPPAPAKGGA